MINYEKEYAEKLKDNIKDLLININKEDYKLKINNFCKKFNYDFDIVKNKILSDEIFASMFVKDPAKQNIYENSALKYLKELNNNFIKLPTTGNNCIYLTENGEITNKKQSISKSVDFYCKVNNKKIYITHKYTKDSGGAQDNQFNDAKEFIIRANKNNDSDKVFIAILDGKYYENKMDVFKNQKTIVISIKEIEDCLKKI